MQAVVLRVAAAAAVASERAAGAAAVAAAGSRVVALVVDLGLLAIPMAGFGVVAAVVAEVGAVDSG